MATQTPHKIKSDCEEITGSFRDAEATRLRAPQAQAKKRDLAEAAGLH
jgi:hypothetical protein